MMLLRAKDIDLMPQIQENCAPDLAKFCSSNSEKYDLEKRGSELKCLQSNYRQLEDSCRDSIREFTQDENKDIRLDQILMRSCTSTIQEYCQDIKEEKNELLECLIAQKQNPKMDEKCRAGIEHHQIINLENVELNVKFLMKCNEEIQEHCPDRKTSTIKVVQCLSEIVLKDTLLENRHQVGGKCRRQLRFELLQLNENIRLDPELDLVCKNDVKEFCSNMQEGKGQVLECLRNNLKKISVRCRAKLSKRDRMNLVDPGSDYILQNKCKNAIKIFCDQDENEDLIGCLRKHLQKPTIEQVK
jgi:Golgi apparatus protein 1